VFQKQSMSNFEVKTFPLILSPILSQKNMSKDTQNNYI